MATFTITGYEIISGPEHTVSGTKIAELQFVAPLGHATLDFRYVAEDASSADISLSDYNLLLNGVHLNDGVLPDRIEVFNMTWPAASGAEPTQVFNLAYNNADGTHDYMFSVGAAPLPDLTDTYAAESLLSNASFSMLKGAEVNNIFTLQLDDISGVSVAGVIQQMFDLEASAFGATDSFDFNYNPDAEAPDLTEFDIMARALENDHLGQDAGKDAAAALEPDPYAPTEPGYDDLVG